ncbi:MULTISPECIES: hypothetical protein [unclassified Campylobacter]|nr:MULTISPECIES: hypothetical protein [unclassified Campylobacter]
MFDWIITTLFFIFMICLIVGFNHQIQEKAKLRNEREKRYKRK